MISMVRARLHACFECSKAIVLRTETNILFNSCAGLKKHISHAQFTIDPTSHGNIGRFLNHSCCPNVSTVELLLSDDLQEVSFVLCD